MKALCWHGKKDIRCDTVTDPKIEDPRDAVVKVTSCAICGSDLHLFHKSWRWAPASMAIRRRANCSVVETTNAKKYLADKVSAHPVAGLFGYTHLTGGIHQVRIVVPYQT